MTDDTEIQERQAQTEEVLTKDIYINVGVDKWDDKNIEALPVNLNKKIQVYINATREIGLQVTRFSLQFAKSVNTMDSMSFKKEFIDSATITEIDSEMWSNIDQASKKMIALIKNNTIFVNKNQVNKIQQKTGSGIKIKNNIDDDTKSEKS